MKRGADTHYPTGSARKFVHLSELTDAKIKNDYHFNTTGEL